MNPKILILIGILITTFACNSDDNTQINIDGRYVGTFERNEMTSNVEINFSSGDFSGESDRTNFPAIYYGNFSVLNNSLNFDNEQLIITTEFDPNLVLDGVWNYEIKNDTLTITNSIGDIYVLTKE